MTHFFGSIFVRTVETKRFAIATQWRITIALDLLLSTKVTRVTRLVESPLGFSSPGDVLSSYQARLTRCLFAVASSLDIICTYM